MYLKNDKPKFSYLKFLSVALIVSLQLTVASAPAQSVTKKGMFCPGEGGMSVQSEGHSWYLTAFTAQSENQEMISTYGYGHAWYSTLWPLFEQPTFGAQVGLASTWINPVSYKQLKLGQMPEGEKSVFIQSIEGSLGWWQYTAYRNTMPKFQPGVTVNNYATGAREFLRGEPIAKGRGGWITINNQILLPFEGMTFTNDSSGKQLGQSWLSLPFPKTGSALGASAGTNAWTLFLNGENFKGPIAYIEPNFWAQSVLKVPRLSGYTMDNQMGTSYQIAGEFGALPYCQTKDANGTVYSRLPQLQFPTDSDGRFIFARDYRSYSDQAIANNLIDALAHNSELPTELDNDGVQVRHLQTKPNSVYQGAESVPALQDLLELQTFDGGTSVGFDFGINNSMKSLPTYFVQDGNTRVPTNKADAPLELQNYSFVPTKKMKVRTYEPNAWFRTSGKAASKVFKTKLNDGSTVSYRWYKFVDQPMLKRFKWTAQEKATMQALVVKIQHQWASNPMQADPSGGELASFDSALLVTPPKGLEYGYVPIVIKQATLK